MCCLPLHDKAFLFTVYPNLFVCEYDCSTRCILFLRQQAAATEGIIGYPREYAIYACVGAKLLKVI